MSEKNRALALAIRRALLLIVDALEEWLDISPRTSELRKGAKQFAKEAESV